MRVLHITNAYPYVEYPSFGIFVKEQIDSLNELEIKNKVFFINAKKNGVAEYTKRKKDLLKTLADFKPDVIHCHHEFSTLPLFLKNLKQPIILSLLGDLNKRSFINKMIFKISALKVKHVIIKNRPIKNKFYTYIPNGVNLEFFKPIDKGTAKEKIGLDKSKKYILFVTASLNNPIKRYDKYQAVIKKLNTTFHDQNFEELILSGVQRNVVPYYFNAAEFILVTSDHEGSPNAVKEAMACNLPIVSTDVGNVKELFGHSKGNFLANDGSVEELFSLSILALNQTSSSGRERLIELRLDMESVAKKISQLYQQLLR